MRNAQCHTLTLSSDAVDAAMKVSAKISYFGATASCICGLPNSVKGWFAGAVQRLRAADEIAVAEAEARGEEPTPIFPRVTPHDLRHAAASLAISAGANVKAVQRMLGHASAAMTLDVYGDLFDDDLDGVAKALNKAHKKQLLDSR